MGVQVRADWPLINHVNESKPTWEKTMAAIEDRDREGGGVSADRIFSLTLLRPGESLKKRRRKRREGGRV